MSESADKTIEYAQDFLQTHLQWPIKDLKLVQQMNPNSDWIIGYLLAMSAGTMTSPHKKPEMHINILNDYLVAMIGAAHGMIDNIGAVKFADGCLFDLLIRYQLGSTGMSNVFAVPVGTKTVPLPVGLSAKQKSSLIIMHVISMLGESYKGFPYDSSWENNNHNFEVSIKRLFDHWERFYDTSKKTDTHGLIEVNYGSGNMVPEDDYEFQFSNLRDESLGSMEIFPFQNELSYRS